MTTLRRYWAGLDRKPIRLSGALVLVISALLMWTSPTGSTRNHVGLTFMLAGMALLYWIHWKKRS